MTKTERDEIERFRKAARAYTRRATRTWAAARRALAALGTHTKDGRLTAGYR